MGCNGSKADDLPLVIRCRRRRDLVRAAARHRYALAAAHASYFRSLKDVGDALRKFVDEELVAASTASSSTFSSPSLILPPGSKKKQGKADGNGSPMHLHYEDESHLHLSDSSSTSEGEDSEDYKQGDDDTYRNHEHHQHDAGVGKFEDEARNLHDEHESSAYNPRGGFSGYSNGYGDGAGNNPFPYPFPFPYPYSNPPAAGFYGETYMDRWNDSGAAPPQLQPWNHYSSNSNMYYMKKSSPATTTVVQEPPAEPASGYSGSFWNPPAGYAGNYGYFSNVLPSRAENAKSGKETPPPPSPEASAWNFLNPFDGFDNGVGDYYSSGRYAYVSSASSPSSTEVREREGIPELEEETEGEVVKEATLKGGRMRTDTRKNSSGKSSRRSRAPPARRKEESKSRTVTLPTREGSLSSVKLHKTEDSSNSRSMQRRKSGSSSRSLPSRSSEEAFMTPEFEVESAKPSTPSQNGEDSSELPIPTMQSTTGKSGEDSTVGIDGTGPVDLINEESSLEDDASKNVDESSLKKRGVTFEVEETSKNETDSSKLSSITLLSPRGTRDLKGVVAEIRNEFETASTYGQEVAVMLEVGKMPYEPKFLKAIISRLLYLMSPSLSHDTQTRQKSSSGKVKLATSPFEDDGQDLHSKALTLSSTLDKLYAWEKKLCKEVKGEERLRIIYEKKHKRLQVLDEEGAESGKIDAARASVRRLLTKLEISIKAIDVISSRIHELRDEELQPQIADLIHGLIRMWKAMLNCHQKQFRAIMESKMRRLRAIISIETQSSTRALTELERQLRLWTQHFNDWIGSQKSYVESLNGWLLQCLQYEPEETPDGLVPYSPGKLGAPPIFVICNDWQQALKAASESKVAHSMNAFAMSLRQLWEKQDEEMRQRLKAEYLKKDYRKKLRTQRTDTDHDQDAMSDKTGLSMVPSDNGASAMDDLKVDLDSLRQRLTEERIKHKDALKLVQDATCSSLQGGLVPIFKALENFTSKSLKAHEHVRLQYPAQQQSL